MARVEQTRASKQTSSFPPVMSNSAGPSTTSTPSRKRSKWDVADDDVEEAERSFVKKRARPKTVKAVDVNELQRDETSLPPPPTKTPSLRSKYVPVRIGHPPLSSARSVYCYERLNQIEEGTYGVVYRAKDKQTGDIVALKRLKLDEERYGFPITALREINALIACRHENVVGIREVVVGETLTQFVYLTLYYCYKFNSI